MANTLKDFQKIAMVHRNNRIRSLKKWLKNDNDKELDVHRGLHLDKAKLGEIEKDSWAILSDENKKVT